MIRRYHKRFVRSRELQVNDLVLQWVLNWEGINESASRPLVDFGVLNDNFIK
jgi:hypothetical protein